MKKTISTLLFLLPLLAFVSCKKQSVVPKQQPQTTIAGTWKETFNDVSYNVTGGIYNESTAETKEHPYTYGFTQSYIFSKEGNATKFEHQLLLGSSDYTEFTADYTIKSTSNAGDSLILVKSINNSTWDVQDIGGISQVVKTSQLTPTTERWSISLIADTVISLHRSGIYFDQNNKSYPAVFTEVYHKE
jgi:hypothetical protein